MQVDDKLRSVGLKTTAQRLKVLQVFQNNERRYLNADEVYRQAIQGTKDIGRATVYRTLLQLTAAGILVRGVLDAGSGVALYKLQTNRHCDALVCMGCEQVESVVDDVLALRSRVVAESNGFVLHRYQLTLYGYCAKCRRQQDRDE
jgi:Fur family transcriptional regulator, ferric uptake regulator